jgi:hypothetical protein
VAVRVLDRQFDRMVRDLAERPETLADALAPAVERVPPEPLRSVWKGCPSSSKLPPRMRFAQRPAVAPK